MDFFAVDIYRMKETVCKFAWSSVTSTMVNTFRPCCRFPFDDKNQYPTTDQVLLKGQQALNNAFMTDLRKDMLDGVKRSECSKCYVEEESGIKSMRQKGNEALSSECKSVEFENLEFLEISLDNLCNLECRMCESTFSTKLQQRDKFLQNNGFYIQPINVRYKTLEMMDKFDLTHLKAIKMLGGEPLISPNLLKFLDKIPYPHLVDLFIVTNATTIPNETVLEKFNQFKSVKFTFSIDGIYQFNDYQRVGSSFESSIGNSLFLSQMYQNNHSIHSVYSSLNIFGLNDSVEWFEKYMTLGLSIDIVSCNFLSPYNSPTWYAEAILDHISPTNSFKNYVSNLFDQYHNYQPEEWNKFLKFVKLTDDMYNTDIGKINPLLKNELDKLTVNVD